MIQYPDVVGRIVNNLLHYSFRCFSISLMIFRGQEMESARRRAARLSRVRGEKVLPPLRTSRVSCRWWRKRKRTNFGQRGVKGTGSIESRTFDTCTCVSAGGEVTIAREVKFTDSAANFLRIVISFTIAPARVYMNRGRGNRSRGRRWR